MEGCQLGVIWGTTTQRIINFKAFAGFRNRTVSLQKWLVDVILGNIDGDFLVDNSHLDNFFVCFVWKKALVFKVKNNSFIDFLSKLSYSATIFSFLLSSHNQPFLKKTHMFRTPIFSDQLSFVIHHWSDFYLHNKHIIIKLKSLKICHYPVFFYICTQSHVAFKQKNWKNLLFSTFLRVGRQDSNSVQVNFSFWERSFILQLFNKGYFWGLFFYNKYLRNQGWKRCKTNVNFQLYIFSCRMEQFMKKGSIFFAAAQYCGRKKVIFDCEC